MQIRQLAPAFVLFHDKFEAETTREIDAVNCTRDTQVGGYELLTAAGLKKLIDGGKPMVPVDTSWKGAHLPLEEVK